MQQNDTPESHRRFIYHIIKRQHLGLFNRMRQDRIHSSSSRSPDIVARTTGLLALVLTGISLYLTHLQVKHDLRLVVLDSRFDIDRDSITVRIGVLNGGNVTETILYSNLNIWAGDSKKPPIAGESRWSPFDRPGDYPAILEVKPGEAITRTLTTPYWVLHSSSDKVGWVTLVIGVLRSNGRLQSYEIPYARHGNHGGESYFIEDYPGISFTLSGEWRVIGKTQDYHLIVTEHLKAATKEHFKTGQPGEAKCGDRVPFWQG